MAEPAEQLMSSPSDSTSAQFEAVALVEQAQQEGQSAEPKIDHQQPGVSAAQEETQDAEVQLEAKSQAHALASLKDLCDSGLLPMNLYQENVAAIHRSSRRLQQWRDRLREKSHQLLDRYEAMQVRQWSCSNHPLRSWTPL